MIGDRTCGTGLRAIALRQTGHVLSTDLQRARARGWSSSQPSLRPLDVASGRTGRLSPQRIASWGGGTDVDLGVDKTLVWISSKTLFFFY